MGERSLIRLIRGRASAVKAVAAVRIGIGDDCAVLRAAPNEEILVTTDFFIEGVHFRRDWQSARSAGHWCLARGLSDVAAMGGRPIAAFLSLACPAGLPGKWTNGFVGGIVSLGARFGVQLSGGDTSSSPQGVVADLVVAGTIPRNRAVLRSGAKAGDAVYVTNSLGRARAELNRLLDSETRHAKMRQYLPQPQVHAGQKIRDFASAMIDVSDGLSTDLAHLCEESGCSSVIDSAHIPIEKSATLEEALHGGDDYQLLFTVPPGRRVPAKIGDTSLVRIGEIVARQRSRVLLRSKGTLQPLRPLGWQHRI